MFHHSHAAENPLQTQGRLIHWAQRYDLVVNLITLGQSWRLRRLTVELAQIKPGDSVLDVGCGTGDLTLQAQARAGASGHVHGIDPSPEMIAVAQAKAAHRKVEIDFRIGVIESLPFSDSSLDVVTSSLMMHHLPDDLKARGMGEIYRVLKPNGRVLIFDFSRPTHSLRDHLRMVLFMHSGLKSGVEDLPKMLQAAGFAQAAKLDEKFLFFGFVRGVK